MLVLRQFGGRSEKSVYGDMTNSRVFTSIEVRWFFDGPADARPALRRWFETAEPLPKRAGTRIPEWRSRLDDLPDVYLLLPGAQDMGIKWREGLLQIKGLVESAGHNDFGNGHSGAVERWIKWSYAGMPAAYRQLFTDASLPGVRHVAVRKTRALRLLQVDSPEHAVAEVAANSMLEHGIAVELTDLEVSGSKFCSLGFEAFPDEPALAEVFDASVSRFLSGLAEPTLDAERSLSYPAFLNRLAAG